MRFLYWAVLAIFSILFTALTCIIAPVLPLFITKENKLPTWLSWFGTLDNDMDGDRSDWTTLPVGSYLRRVLWIWRNPAYGFETKVLGAEISYNDALTVRGNVNIKNRDDAVEGTLFVQTYSVYKPDYWCWRMIKQISAERCLMIELGWKLQVYAQYGLPRYSAPDERAQLVFSIRISAFYPKNG